MIVLRHQFPGHQRGGGKSQPAPPHRPLGRIGLSPRGTPSRWALFKGGPLTVWRKQPATSRRWATIVPNDRRAGEGSGVAALLWWVDPVTAKSLDQGLRHCLHR